jgi:hypothetical protein
MSGHDCLLEVNAFGVSTIGWYTVLYKVEYGRIAHTEKPCKCLDSREIADYDRYPSRSTTPP